MSYQGPDWAATPSETWTLVEIKSGVQVTRHTLSSRPFTLIGRDADQCPIVLQHESCSRLHARIAFDLTSGTPWLRDLQSTHGTKVNKKVVPAASTGKTESNSTKPGSRGIVIYPADILQFGASTRMFCLEGPESFGRNKVVLPKMVPKSKPSALEAPSAVVVDNEANHHEAPGTPDNTIGWGMDIDDHDPSNGNDVANEMKLPANLAEQDIPERLRKDWNALRAAQYKLEHTREESERIKRKGLLSEGQEKQLERNEERIASLREDIEAKEMALFRKLYPEKMKQKKQREAEKSAYFDDDDVEDRTRDRKHSNLAVDEAETEEGLLRKRNKIFENWQQVHSRIQAQSTKCYALKKEIASMKANGDEETFFTQNDLDMATDALKQDEGVLGELVSSLDEVDKLLKVINPNSVLEKPIMEVAENDDDIFSMPKPVSRAPTVTLEDNDGFPVPPPVLPPPPNKPAPDNKDAELLPPPPPPKRQRVQGAAMPPPGFAVPATMGTAASISSLLDSPASSSSAQAGRPLRGEQKKGPQAVTEGEEQHDKWKPPKDQDGSGYTKLNAKFAGRY